MEGQGRFEKKKKFNCSLKTEVGGGAIAAEARKSRPGLSRSCPAPWVGREAGTDWLQGRLKHKKQFHFGDPPQQRYLSNFVRTYTQG